MSIDQLVAEAVAMLGLQGVSVVALAGLVSVVVWSSRARRAGYVAGQAVGTARWVAVSLLLLGVGGVVTFHPQRAAGLATWLWDVGPRILRFLGGLV